MLLIPGSALRPVFTKFSSFPGLDAAGKTTILYKLKLGEIVTTIPTIGKTGRKRNFLFTL